MAVTEQTRTGLIGLSVAMLGSAPGTDLLNEWVAAHEGGMSLEDIANHIAGSDAFQATYPAFLTNAEFAADFLGNVLGDNVSAELTAAAEGIVVGLLNDGMTRGALALAVVVALHDIAMAGMDHPAYADLGMAAMAFHNQIEVAEHYTLNARMAEPSADVLDGVTSDADSVTMAIDAIDNPTAGDPAVGQTFVLTTVRDDIDGTMADDLIVAEPVAQVSNVFQETLNPFDDIDGGDGNDTIAIYGVVPTQDLELGAESVSNVENVILNTVGGIDADMSHWDGLEAVNLERYGRDSDVSVTVDGAMVSAGRPFGGSVSIDGAGGAVDIEAGSGSMVHIGSGDHTGSVMVKGGMSVTVGKNADGSGQSMTVTSVSVDGVAHNSGTEVKEASDDYVAMVDDDGYVVGSDGTTRVTVTVGTADAVPRVRLADDGETLVNANDGSVIMVTDYSFDHDGDDGDGTGDTTANIDVNVAVKFNKKTGGLVFGAIQEESGALPTGITDANGLDGMAIPSGTIVYTNVSIGKESAGEVTRMEGGGPTLTVNSDAIESVALHNTTATVLVHNNSMTADKKPMPEDLSITVDKYGSKTVMGKLCVAGDGSAENIMLTVAGDSWVDLNSNAIKMLDVSADAKLTLSVSKFKDGQPDGASDKLESVTISGAGDVTMDLDGLSKLASVDASASSGKNSLKADGALAALTSVMTGSGNDTVMLAATPKLASISTGDGGDMVTVSGAHRKEGLMVDLGAGDDRYSGGAGDNGKSRVDGGDGMDTLMLANGSGATYTPEGSKEKMSIYTGFEVLDAGGGAGAYDLKLLGVDYVTFSKNTAENGRATLNNVMKAGMGFSVMSGMAGQAVTAKVDYNLETATTSSRFDAADGGIFTIDLTAVGGKDDKDANPKASPAVAAEHTGAATVDLTVDSSIDLMIVDSNARTGGSASAGGYENVVCVGSSNIDAVKITGDSMLVLKHVDDDTTTTDVAEDEGLAMLRYVDATGNSAGVTVTVGVKNIATKGDELEMMGGDGGDTFNGGAGMDVLKGNGGKDTLNGNAGVDMLMGGAGDDMLDGGADNDMLSGGAGADKLTGGDGDDQFQFASAADSQASINATTGAASGHDVIMDWGTGTDTIGLTKSLLARIGQRTIGTRVVNDSDAQNEGDTDTTANSLGALIRKGDNFFVTPDGTLFDATSDTTHSVITVQQTNFTTDSDDDGTNDADPAVTRTWVLIDVDSDGNFDAGTDMVIELMGTTDNAITLTSASFSEIPA